MRSGTRILHWDTPAPPATQRLHLSTKVGDSKHGIRLAARRGLGADGVKALDFNMQTVAVSVERNGVARFEVVPVSGHWAQLGRNGYTRCYQNGRLRVLTRAEKRLTYQQWVNRHGCTLASLQTLRRRNGDYPLTWGQAVQYAASKGVMLTPELKSPAFARRDVAEGMIWACKKFDYPLWAMALPTMKFAAQKCAAVVGAGGSFCLIFGRGIRGRIRRIATGRRVSKGWTVPPTRFW